MNVVCLISILLTTQVRREYEWVGGGHVFLSQGSQLTPARASPLTRC